MRLWVRDEVPARNDAERGRSPFRGADEVRLLRMRLRVRDEVPASNDDYDHDNAHGKNPLGAHPSAPFGKGQ
jgi:hypothetical protein